MSYKAFADFYDTFTDNVGYSVRTEYILKLFERFDRRPTLLLDVGCGTGGFSYCFSENGIEVIGADPSEEMLSVAASKASSVAVSPIFLNQSAEQLELYGTVDGAVSCLDSINHITDVAALRQAFSRISLFLEPERLFIFDVNTLYKHKKVLSGKKFLYDSGDRLCIWKNSRCSRNGTVKMKLKLYSITPSGTYAYKDTNIERAYPVELLAELLEEAGLKPLGVFGDMTLTPPREDEERIYIVTEKVI